MRSAASGPAAARAWRIASRSRARRRTRESSKSEAPAGVRRAEALDGQPQGLGRRGQQRQALGKGEAHAPCIAQRLAEDDALAPGATLDQRRAEDDGA